MENHSSDSSHRTKIGFMSHNSGDDEFCEDTRTSIVQYGPDPPEILELSDMIIMFRDRPIGAHDNVFEGEIKSLAGVYRPCVVKFSLLNKQIENEATILTKLGSHSNIISLILSGAYSGLLECNFYLVLDKCHNQNLGQYIMSKREAGEQCNSSEILEFARQIVAGVTYLHDNRVIHLDLKPSNVLISLDFSRVKVADFGLSVVLPEGQCKIFHKSQFGTNGYRPIESFGNNWVSRRTDVFSLGTVLFNMLSCGKNIFGGDEHALIHNVMNDITDFTGLCAKNPNTWEHLIGNMIKKERSRRPSIYEVAEHPCWVGDEVEITSGYYDEEETVNDASLRTDSKSDASSRNKGAEGAARNLLYAIRRLGCIRKPAVVIFNRAEFTLMSFNPATYDVSLLSTYSAKMSRSYFAAVCLDEYIYVFLHDQSVYRLEYGDESATWHRRSDAIQNHGYWCKLASDSESIYVADGKFAYLFANKVMSKYHTATNSWSNINPKHTATSRSTLLVANGLLYCFGGINEESAITASVEGMDLRSMKWTQLASMRVARSDASAVQYGRKIFVLGGITTSEITSSFAEIYDPDLNTWVTGKSLNRVRESFNTFCIGSKLFAVSGDHEYNDQVIEMYDSSEIEWHIALQLKDMHVSNAVLVTVT